MPDSSIDYKAPRRRAEDAKGKESSVAAANTALPDITIEAELWQVSVENPLKDIVPESSRRLRAMQFALPYGSGGDVAGSTSA